MKFLLRLVGVLCYCVTALCQGNLITSPEVLADKRVVFRVDATNAHTVAVFGDWMKTGTSEPFTRTSSGTWECTLGPLKPGIYIYHFIVDGLNIADPVNPRMKLRARTSASVLEVPGNSEYWEFRDVPHGKIEINFHNASALVGSLREVWVYTPPGYAKETTKRYPVLYLLHGSNDTPAGWTQLGRANFTLDNLLAEGKAREMIIVTPFGHAQPITSRDGRNTPLFEEYLLRDVIPMIEANYRVEKDRRHRAIAGFSMGGAHALHIGFKHLDMFSAIALLSPGVPRDFETQFASVLQNPSETNKKLDLFWIACGKDDFLFDAAERLSATLNKSGIKHQYRATEGAHTFNVWRGYFHEFAPLLFQKETR